MRQPGDLLRLKRVRHVVTFREVLSIVKNSADIDVSFDVRDAQRRATLHVVRPRGARLQQILKELVFVHGPFPSRTVSCNERASRPELGLSAGWRLRPFPRIPTNMKVSSKSKKSEGD